MAVSITLATKGMVAMVRGTIAAVVPIAFPAINLVMGIRITISMMKGKLLNTFTTKSSTPYTTLLGLSPSLAVKVRIPAGMKPKITANNVAKKLM